MTTEQREDFKRYYFRHLRLKRKKQNVKKEERKVKRKRGAETQKERYARLRAHGLCPVCGNAAVEGKTYCSACADKRNAAARRRWAKRNGASI